MSRGEALAVFLLGAFSGLAIALTILLLFPDRAQGAVWPWILRGCAAGAVVLLAQWGWARLGRRR